MVMPSVIQSTDAIPPCCAFHLLIGFLIGVWMTALAWFVWYMQKHINK